MKIPCDICIKMKQLKKKIVDCASCKPTVMNENMPVMYLVERYSTVIFAEHGLSGAGLSLALQEPWIEKEDKSVYAKKVVLYLNTLKSEINKGK
jgi:hypothetical protein